MSCLTKTCCDKKLDTTHLRKEAASLAGSVVGQAEKAALWAAPHVSKAAGGVARAAKDAQERLEPVVHEARYRVVEDYIPRAQRAAVAAQAAAGTDGTLTERAQRVAVAAKSAALEVPVKKQKKHRVLKTLGWLAVAGAAAAGAYVVWRRSQPGVVASPLRTRGPRSTGPTPPRMRPATASAPRTLRPDSPPSFTTAPRWP